MKKQLLYLGILVTGIINAQPLTHTVLPPVGTTYVQYNVLNQFPHPTGGANANWNFNLTTNVFMTCSVSPSSILTSTDVANFPTANYFTQVFNGASFFRLDMEEINTNEFKLNGQRSFSGSYVYSPVGLITYPVGLSFGSTHTFTFIQSANTVTCSMTFDGYGNFTASAAGTHSSVLRLKIKNSNSTDTIFKYYGTQPYMRLLLQYSKSTSGFIGNKYVFAYSFPTAIEENNFSESVQALLYPNPASDIIYFEQPFQTIDKLNVTVYNSMFQAVDTKLIKENALNISDLSPGVYYLEISNKESKSLKRFIKY